MIQYEETIFRTFVRTCVHARILKLMEIQREKTQRRKEELGLKGLNVTGQVETEWRPGKKIKKKVEP